MFDFLKIKTNEQQKQSRGKAPKTKKKPKKKKEDKTATQCYKGICTTLDILEAEIEEMKNKGGNDNKLLKKLEDRVFELYQGI